MFVIATIFTYFRVPSKEQHRVLFWGIMVALILRGVMIALGVVLITQFTWMVYVFGALLIVTALKMHFSKEEELHPDRNLAVRLRARCTPSPPTSTAATSSCECRNRRRARSSRP